MAVHAIEAALALVATAGISGLGGVVWGARITTRHDRAERKRDKRLAAAVELGKAWATALFAIDNAITVRELGCDDETVAAAILHAHRDVSNAVTSSILVDLLFGTTSWSSANTNAVRDDAREALHALQNDDAQAARRHHFAASASQSYLVIVLAEAIESTGTKSDVARTFHEALKVPDIDPARRRSVRAGARP